MTDPGFPGLCDVCGGEQVWTSAHGEIWVSCVGRCTDQLELLDQPSLIAKGAEWDDEHWNLPREGRVDTLEGGDANVGKGEIQEPPAGWLSTMWLGGYDGS